MTSPGYPETYNVPQECSNVVTVDTNVAPVHVQVRERLAHDVYVYACGNPQEVHITFTPIPLPCRQFDLLSRETFLLGTSVAFRFREQVSESRGLLLEVTSGEAFSVLFCRRKPQWCYTM